MGLIQKKDEKDEIDGSQISERGEGQAQSGRQKQGNKLLHGVSSFQSGVDGGGLTARPASGTEPPRP